MAKKEDIIKAFKLTNNDKKIISNNCVSKLIISSIESINILKKAEEVGLIVKDFSVSGASLETVFLSMTSKK